MSSMAGIPGVPEVPDVPGVPQSLVPLITGLEAPHLPAAFRARSFDYAELGTGREAAVMVLLTGLPDVVLIERARTLRKHAGQVAFPGGAVDDTDPDPVATALRETEEEIGLNPDRIGVLGRLPSARIPVSRFHVHGVVGWWEGDSDLRTDPIEVASVRQVPVSDLVDPENRSTWRHPASGHTGPGFAYDDLYVWGFTAYVLDAVLTAGGWQRPWDQDRIIDVPKRFMS